MDENEDRKYLNSVGKKLDYNLKKFDSMLQNCSAGGIVLLVFIFMRYEFSVLSHNIYFALSFTLLMIAMLSQLLSYKMAGSSADHYLLYNLLCSEECAPEDKSKAFERGRLGHSLSTFFGGAALLSFTFGCIAFVMFLTGVGR
jgi:hypothetical protein